MGKFSTLIFSFAILVIWD